MSDRTGTEDALSERTGALGQSRAALGADLGAVAAVAVLLVAVHLLVPVSVQGWLAFQHDALALSSTSLGPLTLLTAAYVHADLAHLVSNVGGFVSLAVVTYLACLAADRRAWFRRTLVVFLVALPVAVNLTSYALLAARFPGASPVSRGFSGVVAGFGGFLLVAVGVQLRGRYSLETAFLVVQFAVVLLLGELLWIYAARVSVVEGVLVGSGLALSVAGLLARGRAGSLASDHYRQVGLDLAYVGLVLALLVWLVYGLFPAEPIAGDAYTNIFAHAAGFVEGGLLAALALVARRPPSHRQARR